MEQEKISGDWSSLSLSTIVQPQDGQEWHCINCETLEDENMKLSTRVREAHGSILDLQYQLDEEKSRRANIQLQNDLLEQHLASTKSK